MPQTLGALVPHHIRVTATGIECCGLTRTCWFARIILWVSHCQCVCAARRGTCSAHSPTPRGTPLGLSAVVAIQPSRCTQHGVLPQWQQVQICVWLLYPAGIATHTLTHFPSLLSVDAFIIICQNQCLVLVLFLVCLSQRCCDVHLPASGLFVSILWRCGISVTQQSATQKCLHWKTNFVPQLLIWFRSDMVSPLCSCCRPIFLCSLGWPRGQEGTALLVCLLGFCIEWLWMGGYHGLLA